MITSRPVHGLERVWLAADRVLSPFVNQLVVEGSGALDAVAWSAAVESAARVHPLLRVRLRGAGRWTRWQADGPAPRVRSVDGSAWDGTNGDGAPFLQDPLDTDAGPVAEVLLVAGGVPRVVFRSHHAVVDGRAARAFAEDVCRALRGEAPTGAASEAARMTDVEVAARAWPDTERASTRPRALGTVAWGLPPGPPCWARVELDVDTHDLLPRVLCALRDVAVRGTATQPSAPPVPLRVSLPVDLATRAGLPPVDANLSGLACLDVPAAAVPADVRRAIDLALPLSGDPLRVAHALRDVPISWLAAGGRSGARRLTEDGLAQEDVTVSNLGRANLGALCGAGFTARRCFWIPPANPGNPLFVSLTGCGDTLTICATACTSDSERLRGLLAEARDRLTR